MPNHEEAKLVVQQSGRRSSGFRTILVLVLILAMAGVIVYLLSLLNSRKYFLVPEGNQLVVKKGIFFPVGQDNYRPADPQEAELYQPVEMPEQMHLAAPMEFEDLPSLNRELANILMEHAEKTIFSKDEKSYQKGLGYLQRASRLHGLDPRQLERLQAMRADADYIEAKRAYLEVEKLLENALLKFEKARIQGSGRFKDAGEWSQKLQRLLEAIRNAKSEMAAPAAPLPAPAPAATEPPAEARQ